MNFDQQFNSFRTYIKLISRRYSAATGVPEEEFESALNEEFFLKYRKYKEEFGKFSAYMKVVLTQCALRVGNREERKFYDSIEYIDGQAQENDQGEEAAVFEIPDAFDLEGNEVIKQGNTLVLLERKKDEDKRQLINALLCDADDITKKIVKEFLRGEHANPTAIGKALGIHPQTVFRKLERMARNFNERTFGEINQYLAV